MTTKLNSSTPDKMVMMKSLKCPGGHPRTRLSQKCAAICNWIVPGKENNIDGYAGKVDVDDLMKVVLCVEANQPKSTQS